MTPPPTGCLDPAVEAAAYLFCSDVAPTDTAGRVHLHIDAGRPAATIIIRDPPTPAADPGTPPEWRHAADRVAALDGAILFDTTQPGPISIQAVIPLPEPTRSPAGTAAGH